MDARVRELGTMRLLIENSTWDKVRVAQRRRQHVCKDQWQMGMTSTNAGRELVTVNARRFIGRDTYSREGDKTRRLGAVCSNTERHGLDYRTASGKTDAEGRGKEAEDGIRASPETTKMYCTCS